jgi:hypothetical protein
MYICIYIYYLPKNERSNWPLWADPGIKLRSLGTGVRDCNFLVIGLNTIYVYTYIYVYIYIYMYTYMYI